MQALCAGKFRANLHGKMYVVFCPFVLPIVISCAESRGNLLGKMYVVFTLPSKKFRA